MDDGPANKKKKLEPPSCSSIDNHQSDRSTGPASSQDEEQKQLSQDNDNQAGEKNAVHATNSFGLVVVKDEPLDEYPDHQ